MKLLSFDIGIKNLAFCVLEKKDDSLDILDWGILNVSVDPICQHCNLKTNSQCDKSAKYKSFSQPLITPKKQLEKWSNNNDLKFSILDYGVTVKENIFEFRSRSCTIPTPLVMAYALAMFNSGKAKKIFCVGFDGYQEGDPRQSEVNLIWDLYFKCDNYVEVYSLTDTLYNIPKSSIYSYL